MSGKRTDIPPEKDDIAVQHKPENATSEKPELEPADRDLDHEDRIKGGPPSRDS